MAGVVPASPAARAGIRAGDVVLEVNRSPVSGAAQAASALRPVQEGDTAFVLVWCDGQEVFVPLTREE